MPQNFWHKKKGAGNDGTPSMHACSPIGGRGKKKNLQKNTPEEEEKNKKRGIGKKLSTVL